MVISHRHRFIFVKTARTAGTSIEIFLSTHCGPEDVLTPFSAPEPGHQPRNFRGAFNPLPELIERARTRGGLRPFLIRATLADFLTRRKYFHHIPAWQVQARTASPVWHDYFKFCVERNPWDKAVSGWSWYRHKYRAQISLDRYLDLLEERVRSGAAGVGAFPFNFPNYTHPRTRRLMVDRVLRYERLEADLPSLLRQLGVPAEGALQARAKSGLRVEANPAQGGLSPDRIRRIERIFRPEIELHGYQPET